MRWEVESALKIKRPSLSYVFLLAALAGGWLAARSGGFASTPIGQLETAALLSLPLLFSGIVFSTLLSADRHISGIMAMNLMGTIIRGLLEYNSMLSRLSGALSDGDGMLHSGLCDRLDVHA